MRITCTVLVLILALVSFPNTSCAQDYYKRHELALQIGAATSFEDDIFNVEEDIESSPEGVFGFIYRQSFDRNWGIGCHFFGTIEETEPLGFQSDNGGEVLITRFDFATYNFGLHAQYNFGRNRIRPYVVFGPSLSFGLVDSPELGTLKYRGVSVLAGPGLAFMVGENFAISAEGIASFGTASWEETPFLNSSGDELNPSLAAVFVNLSLLWGTPSES